ncbi:hypothetical protein BC829DRAFT_378733 [Chytridium lagenaria]|nr:hypothetical protein BC829DRAFT_378733 [Chytridium lagenaria]
MRNPQQSLTSLNLGEETADETARSFTLHRLLHERGGCPFPRRHIECVPYSPKPLDVQRLNLATDFVNGNSSYNLVDLVDQIVGLHILEVRRACDIYYGLRSFGIEESVIAVALGMTPDDFNNFESSLDVKLNDDSMAWWQSPITSYIQRGTQDKDSVLSDIMAVNFLKGNLVEASSQCGWQTVEAQMIPRILTAAAKIWHSNCITAGKDPNAILEGQPSPCRERLMAFIAVDSVM